MKKVKMIFWLIILGLIVVFSIQNWSFLSNKQEIVFNIVYGKHYKLNFPVGVYFLSVLLIGSLIPYLLLILEKFKSKKTIQKLNGAIDNEKKKVSDLESKIATSSMGVARDDDISADKRVSSGAS